MANPYFQFKQFTIRQDKCAMKVTTDACLFGAWAAAEIQNQQAAAETLLEIGTGTGLLSLMIAQKNPALLIDSIEIEAGAAEQATENIRASPAGKNIRVWQADARRFPFSGKYDCIISNPPFYENELTGADSKKNIAHHHEGLLLSELLAIIRTNLQPDGQFFLLLPFKRQEELKRMILQQELFIRQLVLVKPSIRHDYFRILLAGTFDKGEAKETPISEIAIKDETDKYTPAFTGLLKEYYLYL